VQARTNTGSPVLSSRVNTVHCIINPTVGAVATSPRPLHHGRGAIVKPPRSVVIVVFILVLMLAASTVKADG
jgi:hypothetical protein